MSEDKKNTVDENEILNPQPPEEEMIPTKKVAIAARVSSMPLWSFSAINFVGLILIAGVAFSLGYFTSPEQLDDSLQQIKTWAEMTSAEIPPLVEKVENFIDAKFKKNSKKRENFDPTPSSSQEGGTVPERKIKYWQAPMNPGFISKKPGKSPMGMDLIPVYEGRSSDGQITINPTMVQNIGVKTETIKRRTLKHEIRTVGNLTYDERKVHHIHTKYAGWIEKLHVDFTGQEVKENDVLLEIYSPELVSTQEEFVLAMKYRESLADNLFPEISQGANSLLESARRRLELFDVPEHQIEELVRTKKVTRTMHIHSPVRGFVIKKDVLHGMHVMPGKSLYMIADLSNIWVMADIYEYELPWVKLGQEAEMTLSYFPEKKFKGKVTYINPFLDSKTRTLKVRMEFDNPKMKLKPGMYANVILKSTITKSGLAVPESAVIHSGEKELVVVQNKSGGFETREVSLGVKAGSYYQVFKGLKNREKVVVSSNFLIDSESKMEEALRKMESKLGKKNTVLIKSKPVGKIEIEPGMD